MSNKLDTSVIKKKSAVTTDDGFKFGLGFWLAFTIFLIIVYPAITCAIYLVMVFIGLSG